MRVKKEQFRIQKRSVRPAEKRRVHIAARDVLNFPSDYHAKGVLSLPYGNIVEPFEAWYSAQHKMSRIDYYGGNISYTSTLFLFSLENIVSQKRGQPSNLILLCNGPFPFYMKF